MAEAEMTPVSGLEILEQRATDARTALDDLLDHSSVHYNDVNAGVTSIVILGWNAWQWSALPDAAQPAVKRAREATERLRDFARAAVRVAAPDRADQLDDTEKLLSNVIEQPLGSSKGAPASSIDAIKQRVAVALDKYLGVLRSLPTAQGSGERLLVADTSALLERPNLQDWRLDGERWTLVALPQVLSELDERKRDPKTRDAALKVSRQIEDLDRRGDTFSGVPLAGKLSYRDIAITADMGSTEQARYTTRTSWPTGFDVAGTGAVLAQELWGIPGGLVTILRTWARHAAISTERGYGT